MFFDEPRLWTGGGDWEPYEPPPRRTPPRPRPSPDRPIPRPQGPEPEPEPPRRKRPKVEVGLLAGRFDPPHQGHRLVVEFARRSTHRVFIAVASGSRDRIPLGLRVHWLRESFPYATVFPVIGYGTDAVASAARDRLPRPPDKVFSSKREGAALAEALGAAHVLVDPLRDSVPVSASELYARPHEHERYLLPATRPYVVTRVCVSGAGGAGKTTLTRALARAYGTAWVPEYARTVLESGRTPTAEDVLEIAARQRASEDAAATVARGLLFCDTGPQQIASWSRRLFGGVPAQVETWSSRPAYDLHLLLDAREDSLGLRDELARRLPSSTVQLNGASVDDRVERARGIIDGLLQERAFLSAWGRAQAASYDDASRA